MNGILIINKPLGYTSRDIVNIVGKALNTKKIGHTGTLDPNASGVLVLCIGKALKMCELMTSHDKEYIAEVILGISTDTLDMDSNATVLQDVNVNIEKSKIEDVVKSFVGKYEQVVPIYSSVKVNGRKLYEYARSNTQVDLPKKEVQINDISIIDDIAYIDGKIHFNIKCSVSKGTYVRALIRDIGEKLGVPSVMNKLVRTKVGDFNLDNSYTLDDIKSGNFKLIDICSAFPNIKQIVVDDKIANKIKNGVILDKFFDNDIAFIIDKSGNLLALYKNDNDKSRPYKMFMNLSIESRHKKF